MWGKRNDQARLEKNLEFLGVGGGDFVRVYPYTLWQPDRFIDPHDPQLPDDVVATVQLAWKYGLRTMLSFFPGPEETDAAWRQAFARDISSRLVDVPDHVLMEDSGNELGKWMSVGENHATAEAIKAGCGNRFLVGLGAAEQYSDADQAVLYMGPATMRQADTERRQGFGGSRQPYGQAPPWCNVEPIGPYTGPPETDPYALCAQAYMTWMNRGAIYVLHASGTGTSGGSQRDLADGKPANWWEVTNIADILQGLRTARLSLPADCPSWPGSMHSHYSHDGLLPFRCYQGTDWDIQGYPPPTGHETRCYTTQRDGRFLSIVLGQYEKIDWIAWARQRFQVRHLLTGAVRDDVTLEGGATYTLRPDQASVLVTGQYL